MIRYALSTATTLFAACNVGDTTMQVTTLADFKGALAYPFLALVRLNVTGSYEMVLATADDTVRTVTITRAQNGTTALTFAAGDGVAAVTDVPVDIPPAGGTGTVTSVAVSGGTTGLTTSGGPVTTSGTITLAGTLGIANGGTGATTQQAALDALAGAVTSGQVLRGNGTHVTLAAIQAGDVPTLNQNTSGTAADLSATLSVAHGGTGRTGTRPHAQVNSATPSGTTSAPGVMMGLALAITPDATDVIYITISGDMANATAACGAKVQIRYGTGAAPANGDALTGTAVGGRVAFTETPNAADVVPFSLNAVVTGLGIGTAYWVDVSLAQIAGGTASLTQVSASAFEL